MPRVQHSDLVSIDALNGLRDAVETQGLSDPQVVQATTGMQPQFLTTVSVQRPARVFRVLCWNTLVYNYSKAMHNPFVNAVLERVLGALGVDMAILLETRENPSTSLAALEEGKVLDVYRKPKEETTEMDDEPEGDDDEPEGDDDEPEGDDDEPDVGDGVGGIRPSPPRMTSYQWIASETTGRTQMPPAELHLPNPEIKPYHQQYKGHHAPRRLMNKVSAGNDPKGNDREWKQACRDYLLKYYDCTWRDRHVLDSLQAVSVFRFQGDETVEFRPRVCPTCGKPQGYAGWPCGRCDRPQGGKGGPRHQDEGGQAAQAEVQGAVPGADA